MHRIIGVLAVVGSFLVACSDDRTTNPPFDDTDGIRIRKVTQRFGVGTFGIDPNHIQYWIYKHDRDGKITKCEFFGGRPGEEHRTIYDDYSYQGDRLVGVEHYIFYDGRFVKSWIEEYEYGDNGRVTASRIQGWSELTDTWSEGTQEFIYNEQDQLIEIISPGSSRLVFHYDDNGNAWRQDLYPLFEVEYEGPITTTFTFDGKRNPFNRGGARFWLPMGNGNLAPLLVSPNNVVGWEGYSPETGGVISRSEFQYDYDARGLPIRSLETVTSPLTDPEPGTVFWSTEYEYLD